MCDECADCRVCMSTGHILVFGVFQNKLEEIQEPGHKRGIYYFTGALTVALYNSIIIFF